MNRFWMMAVVLLLLVGPVAGWWARGWFARSTPGIGNEPNTVRVMRGRLEQRVKARAIVKPATHALYSVGFPMPKDVARTIAHLPFVEGDPVKKGQVLARLSHVDLSAALRQLQAEEAVAEARLDALVDMEELDLGVAEAASQTSKAQLDFAQRVVDRYAKLTDKTGISTLELETAARDLALGLARFKQANANLEQVRGKFKSDKKVLEKQRDLAKAAVQTLEDQIELCTLLSPMDGVVFAVHRRKGELTSNQPNAPVLTLFDPEQLQLHVYVDENDRGKILVDQSVKFRVEAYAGQMFEGKVARWQPQPLLQENVVYYIAVVAVDKKQRAQLQPEMTALVFVTAGANDNALWLPQAAVRSRADGWYVLQKGPGGIVETPVAIGWRDEGRVEIRQGLSEGEEVLVDQ
jgi:HlyD family secretion protein